MRLYSVSFSAVSLAATQDLFSLTSTAGMAFRLRRIELGQTNVSSWTAFQLQLKRLSGTLTVGSGGTAPTPQKFNFGDAAATVTARANDTTIYTATTSSILFSRGWELLNGFFWAPTTSMEEVIIAPSQALALTLVGTPTMTASGYIEFEELF